MNKPKSLTQLFSLSALLLPAIVSAATIDTTVVLPDEFDGVRADYLQIGNATGSIGMGSASVGAYSQALGDNAFAVGAYASGNYSVALGQSSASGDGAFSVGTFATASGNHSTAFGRYSMATGDTSFALGGAFASGNNSTAIYSAHSWGQGSFAAGLGLLAVGKGTVVFGEYNDAGNPAGESIWQWAKELPAADNHPLNHLFVIGNGTSTNDRSNAMVVYHNGNTDLNGDVAISGGVMVAGSPVVTQATVGQSGALVPDSNSSLNWGPYTGTSGNYATAWGGATHAGGDFSTAWGDSSQATGLRSTAFGHATIASAENSTAIGKYNDPTTNALLTVGNGAGPTNRSNALVSLDSGQTTLENKYWDSSNHTAEPVELEANQGQALVVKGHALLEGNVSFAGNLRSTSSNLDFGLNNSLYSSTKSNIVLGSNNGSESRNALIIGENNYVDGESDIAILVGTGNFIDGAHAGIAVGEGNSPGTNSITVGENNYAFGGAGGALGLGLLTRSYATTVVGQFNENAGIEGVVPSLDDREQPVFVVGNGLSDTQRADALVVKRNGQIIISQPQGDISMGIFGE